MAITSTALVSSLESELLKVRGNLQEVDDNLKRLTGRDFNDPPRIERKIRVSSGSREDEPPPKRRPPGGVFARLGAPVLEASMNDNRGRRVKEIHTEEIEHVKKPMISSSVARPVVDGKSRTEAAAELTKDRASRDRNRRMFGALMGTLQRFRTDEAKQKDKEEQRAAIDRKLEEKGKAVKEELRRERLDLFNQRKEQQARIKRLNFKMARVKDHEAWESHQLQLAKFIRTTSVPPVFWAPKIPSTKSSQLVSATRGAIEEELEIERLRMKEEMDEILGGSADQRHQEEEEEDDEEEPRDAGKKEMITSPFDDRDNTTMDFSNCPDLLDYEAEEGELVFEGKEHLLTGKQKPERVVVQVGGNGGSGSHRRVELVTVVAKVENGRENNKDSSSEKENKSRAVTVVVVDSARERGKEKHKRDKREGRDKEKKEKKHKTKDREGGNKSKHKDKYIKIKEEKGEETAAAQKENSRAKSLEKDLEKRDSKTKKERERIVGAEVAKSRENTEEISENKKDNEEIWSEDLSHISLPLEPQPLLGDLAPTDDSLLEAHAPEEPDSESNYEEVPESAEDISHLEEKEVVQAPVVAEEVAAENPLMELLKPLLKKNKEPDAEASSSSSSSSESEDSSTDSESSMSESSSESSDSTSESTLSSESGGDRKGKKKKPRRKPPQEKRRRTKHAPTSGSSSSDSSDEEDRKKAEISRPLPPPQRGADRKSPPKRGADRKSPPKAPKVKMEQSSDSDSKNRTKKPKGKIDDDKDRIVVAYKRELERKAREECKRKERERMSARDKERKERESARSAARNKRSRSKDRRRDRSRSRDRRRDRK